MRRGLRIGILGGLLALGLGCSGMTEGLVELTTGGQMEISENGDVVMTLPDGSKVVTEQGAAVPADFPLPEPWDGAECQSLVTMTSPEGHTSWIAAYEMGAPRDAIAERYVGWMTEQGCEPKRDKQKAAGMVTETITCQLGEAQAAVTLSEAFGQNSVSVIWAPHGLDDGLR